jgi:hypothetical protein
MKMKSSPGTLFAMSLLSVAAFTVLSQTPAFCDEFQGPMSSFPSGLYKGATQSTGEAGAQITTELEMKASSDGKTLHIHVEGSNGIEGVGALQLQFNPDGSCVERGSFLARKGTCRDGDIILSSEMENGAAGREIRTEEYHFQGDTLIYHTSTEDILDGKSTKHESFVTLTRSAK